MLPKQRLEEYEMFKKKLDENKMIKTQSQFWKKRTRLLKNNWKHGIVGIENTETPLSDVYKQMKAERMQKLTLKERRAKARMKNLIK